MLKMMSAALLAATVIAAPALAAEAGKTATQTPVIKSEATQTRTSAGAVKSDAKAMNANASITRDEHAKSRHSHRHHQTVAKKQLKTQPDADTKPGAPAATGKRS